MTPGSPEVRVGPRGRHTAESPCCRCQLVPLCPGLGGALEVLQPAGPARLTFIMYLHITGRRWDVWD